MRALALCLSLVACSCAQQPIEPSAQTQIATLQDHYAKALAAAHGFCSPMCYRAAGAIVTADTERTREAIAEAKAEVEAMERGQ